MALSFQLTWYPADPRVVSVRDLVPLGGTNAPVKRSMSAAVRLFVS